MRILILLISLALVACDEQKNIVLNTCDTSRIASIQSYYVPGVGTLNLNYENPCNKPLLTGEKLSSKILIMSDAGLNVQLIDGNGDVIWKYVSTNKMKLRGLNIVSNEVSFFDATTLVSINLQSGKIISKIDTGLYYSQFDDVKIIDTKVIYDNHEYTANYARKALVKDNLLFIADTFNHKVSVYNTITKELVFETYSYYPNDLTVKDSIIYIAEEHANRIMAVDYTNGEKSILVGCNEHSIYTDPYSSPNDIIEVERTGILVSENGKGICQNSIYSPNGLYMHNDGTILISNTDAHEVLHLDENGTVIRKITGLNNPARAYIVE